MLKRYKKKSAQYSGARVGSANLWLPVILAFAFSIVAIAIQHYVQTSYTTVSRPAGPVAISDNSEPQPLQFEALAEPQPETLRILALQDPAAASQPAVSITERLLLENYARLQGLEPDWIVFEQEDELVNALASGDGDLIAGQVDIQQLPVKSATDEVEVADVNAADGSDEPSISQTLPWQISQQQVIARNDLTDMPSQPEELVSRKVAAVPNTPAWTRLQEMAIEQPGLIPMIIAAAEADKIFNRLSQGEIDLAVVDSTMADDVTSTHPDLTVAFTLPGSKSRTWATADADLLRSLNQYLNEAALTREINTVRFEDLQAITQRKELRVITYQSPANYYLDEQGELRGFEYELVKRFAKKAGLRLDVLVAPTRQDMIDWLLEGRGDLIAASMPASAVRKDARLNLSRPYNYAAPLIIGRSDEAALIDARDLEGRRIMVPAGSPHMKLLERYRDQGIAVEIVEADPALGIDQILFRVARGMFDLTVVDSHKAKALLAAQPYAQVHFAVSEPLPHVWIMRGASQQLQAAVNDFIDKTYRSREYNILHAKYFEHARDFEATADKKTPELLALGGELSPYDALIRDYSERFGFDWRLIVAQIYQESRFDPQAVSEAGAEGLMQLLPSTAIEVGLTNVMDPETGIHAGLQYLRKLHDRLEEDLTLEDRVWFSLAAYNAGYGRLQMARQLATEMGLDPRRWFGNVEKAMLKLADHTTCQCGQPVAYVRDIRNRYHTYVRLTQATQLADARIARWPGREG